MSQSQGHEGGRAGSAQLLPVLLGELALVVWLQESWQADQLPYLPGPDMGVEMAYPTPTPLMNYWSG